MDTNLPMFTGFGGANDIAALDEMKKALESGYTVPNLTNAGTGGALLRQDISPDLIMQTEMAEDVKFWKSIYKPDQKVTNPVFEYSRQNSVGPRGPLSFWNADGVLGGEADSEIERLYEKCKFLSQFRNVNISMSNLPVLGPSPDAVAKVTEDATLHMLTLIEMALFDGDDSIDADCINGLKRAAADAGTVIDRRGLDVTPEQIAQEAVKMREGTSFGRPNQIWTSFSGQNRLGIQIGDSIRRSLNVGQSVGDGYDATSGVSNVLTTNVGKLAIEGSIFLAPERKKLISTTAVGKNPPATPSATFVAAGAGGLTSLFTAADAGDYKYAVAAVGKGCASFVASSAVTVAAGDKVTITIAAPSSADTKFYALYRSEKDSADMYFITAKKQTYSGDSLANTVIVDLNGDLPNTADTYVLENSPRTMRWRELMGFSRIQLPIPAGTLQYSYAFCSFGGFIVTKPRCVVRFKNCRSYAA